MHKVVSIFLVLLYLHGHGQENLTEKAQPIVEEGKHLYKLEMASWYGTDLFLEKHKDQSSIGGYFSYIKDGIPTCLFYSRKDNPKVIGTISFDSSYDLPKAKVDLAERDFSSTEAIIYALRTRAWQLIEKDSFFRRYENTQFNLIPLVRNGERKVYVLTGARKNGVVMIGNDYLLTFDMEDSLLEKKRLHQNLIPIHYGGNEEAGKQVASTMHSHLPETGDFITATDICTLMLYAKFANWPVHHVLSKKYLNIWNCASNELTVISMDVLEKIEKQNDAAKDK